MSLIEQRPGHTLAHARERGTDLSEHLSSAETAEQLSARFAYAGAMKSMNDLLLLGDGESCSRQSVDFAGLPEMARTFLQVAAGAADMGAHPRDAPARPVAGRAVGDERDVDGRLLRVVVDLDCPPRE